MSWDFHQSELLICHPSSTYLFPKFGLILNERMDARSTWVLG